MLGSYVSSQQIRENSCSSMDGTAAGTANARCTPLPAEYAHGIDKGIREWLRANNHVSQMQRTEAD